MATEATTVTYTIQELLERSEQRIQQQLIENSKRTDVQFDAVNKRMDTEFATVNERMDIGFAAVDKRMDTEFASVNKRIDTQSTEMKAQFAAVNKSFEQVNLNLHKIENGITEILGGFKALNERMNGFEKRLDNQEFVYRSFIVGLFVTLLGVIARAFDWFSIGR
jgi:DNA repair ATPase RecN